MSDEKWKSPHGHAIASHETDRLPAVSGMGVTVDSADDARQRALDAVNAIECLDGTSDYNHETFGSFVWPHKETIKNVLKSTLTHAPVSVKVDLDNAREVFEDWITASGNYPHLKHKSFGGNYLHEETAMKWDGFKAGYYAQRTPPATSTDDGWRTIDSAKTNGTTYQLWSKSMGWIPKAHYANGWGYDEFSETDADYIFIEVKDATHFKPIPKPPTQGE